MAGTKVPQKILSHQIIASISCNNIRHRFRHIFKRELIRGVHSLCDGSRQIPADFIQIHLIVVSQEL